MPTTSSARPPPRQAAAAQLPATVAAADSRVRAGPDALAPDAPAATLLRFASPPPEKTRRPALPDSPISGLRRPGAPPATSRAAAEAPAGWVPADYALRAAARGIERRQLLEENRALSAALAQERATSARLMARCAALAGQCERLGWQVRAQTQAAHPTHPAMAALPENLFSETDVAMPDADGEGDWLSCDESL